MRTMKHPVTLFLLCAVLLTAFSCTSRKTNKPNALQSVKIESVHLNTQESSNVFPGKVKAVSDVNLSFKVSGIVEHIKEVGTAVKKGDVLVEMDPRDYQLQFSATQAEYKQIKGECERVMELYQKNSVSKNDYEKALYGLQQITAKYDAHKNALEDTKLRAPFDGYVQNHFYQEGEIVGQGMPVISMISSGALEVLVYIPMSEYMKRDKMTSFSATLNLFPETVYPLEWIGLSPKANLNQLYALRLQMPQQKGISMPTPGMPVSVHISYRSDKEGLCRIPLEAMFGQQEETYVWVYDVPTQTVHARRVGISEILNDGTALVREGLQEGEQIVTAGVHSLSEAEKVIPIDTMSSTNIGGLL